MFSRLVGMFAFALIDRKMDKLLLARDFFGIKPLYYWSQQGIFAFASEITPLLELPGIQKTVNADRLYQYLCFSKTDYGGETFFRDIRQLPAAHYLEINLSKPTENLEPVRYWNISTHRLTLSTVEAAEQVKKLFFSNIELHTRSDVPVGTLLSGGIDSSAIVMVMRSLLGGNQGFHTFSYLADNYEYNEASWSQLVAQSANTIHHTIQMADALPEDLEKLIRTQQEPFGGTSILAQSKIYEKIQQFGIKVVLDGQGADECLAGYPNYRISRLISLLRSCKFAAGLSYQRKIYNQIEVNPSKSAFIIASSFLPPSLRYFIRQIVNRDISPAWLNAAWFKEREVKFHPLVRKPDSQALTNELIWSITETSLPMLLRNEDRNSMVSSVESRVPFLTPDFVNLVLSLPEDYLINQGGTSKWIFRKAMENIVPQSVLDRRDKIGFKTPEKDWLISQKKWVQSILKSEEAHALTALNLPIAQNWWGKIYTGQMDYSPILWRWINVIQWIKIFDVQCD